mmetsp:Transcript_11446/g.31224  ORF Transcript_11446/g.31224 Transcript_11446/m.31224 type:complete len:264 (-) Transcript_11446:1424-2215(-)
MCTGYRACMAPAATWRACFSKLLVLAPWPCSVPERLAARPVCLLATAAGARTPGASPVLVLWALKLLLLLLLRLLKPPGPKGGRSLLCVPASSNEALPEPDITLCCCSSSSATCARVAWASWCHAAASCCRPSNWRCSIASLACASARAAWASWQRAFASMHIIPWLLHSAFWLSSSACNMPWLSRSCAASACSACTIPCSSFASLAASSAASGPLLCSMALCLPAGPCGWDTCACCGLACCSSSATRMRRPSTSPCRASAAA